MNDILAHMTIGIFVGTFFAWLLTNAAIGCGEPYGSCWLVPWVITNTPQ